MSPAAIARIRPLRRGGRAIAGARPLRGPPKAAVQAAAKTECVRCRRNQADSQGGRQCRGSISASGSIRASDRSDHRALRGRGLSFGSRESSADGDFPRYRSFIESTDEAKGNSQQGHVVPMFAGAGARQSRSKSGRKGLSSAGDSFACLNSSSNFLSSTDWRVF